MSEIENAERPYPRPLSRAKVGRLPSALVPARTALVGRCVTLEPLDAARHASDLFEASHGSEAALRILDYLPWGPWKSEAEFANVLCQQTARQDQIYYAVRLAAGGKACGQTSFLDIQPEQRVIEIGSIWFGLTLRHTRYYRNRCDLAQLPTGEGGSGVCRYSSGKGKDWHGRRTDSQDQRGRHSDHQ